MAVLEASAVELLSAVVDEGLVLLLHIGLLHLLVSPILILFSTAAVLLVWFCPRMTYWDSDNFLNVNFGYSLNFVH